MRSTKAMSVAEMRAELEIVAASFAKRGDHGGSPGEGDYERMSELESAIARRATNRCRGTGRFWPDFPRSPYNECHGCGACCSS